MSHEGGSLLLILDLKKLVFLSFLASFVVSVEVLSAPPPPPNDDICYHQSKVLCRQPNAVVVTRPTVMKKRRKRIVTRNV